MLKSIPLHTVTDWQEELSSLITDPAELFSILELDHPLILASRALEQFPLRVSRPYISRIEKGNPEDPLLLQILPRVQEDEIVQGYTNDPLQENLSNPRPGILHKYRDRALLLPTSVCAIHCRYCFRRHFPYKENTPSKLQWQSSLDYIAENTEISEVILSGGDPLSISDRHLQWLISQLSAIPHLKTLRIHTRFPILIPQRITRELCEMLAATQLKVVMVIHSNHAQELDGDVEAAMRQVKNAGITLLNQTVLLRHINDSIQALADLSHKLFSMDILPYYLHMLDPVKGTAHFDVDIETARELIKQLQQNLPGYLVPRLVREEAGQQSKTLQNLY